MNCSFFSPYISGFIVKGLPDVFVFVIPLHGGHIDRGFAVKRVDASAGKRCGAQLTFFFRFLGLFISVKVRFH